MFVYYLITYSYYLATRLPIFTKALLLSLKCLQTSAQTAHVSAFKFPAVARAHIILVYIF